MKTIFRIITWLILLLILALGVLFSVQNDTPVSLDLLLISFSARPLALWVLLAFVLGGCIGMLTSTAVLWRLRAALLKANWQLRMTREKTQREIT